MNQTEMLLEYGWLIALTVAVGVVSWVYLLLQAVFEDQRIAMVGVFGSLLFSFLFLFPQVVPKTVKYGATFICAVFFLWFVIKNITHLKVYLPALLILLSLYSAYWLQKTYQAAGLP
ncbi:MAG: hypothetical protein R3E90_11695 [Marinicella sp.]|nr:hypothetical protein [Xanthomonadales bacterium]